MAEENKKVVTKEILENNETGKPFVKFTYEDGTTEIYHMMTEKQEAAIYVAASEKATASKKSEKKKGGFVDSVIHFFVPRKEDWDQMNTKEKIWSGVKSGAKIAALPTIGAIVAKKGKDVFGKNDDGDVIETEYSDNDEDED